MITTYRRSGPPKLMILLIAMAMVFGCYLIWTGVLRWFAASGDPAPGQTLEAQERATIAAMPTQPAFLFAPTSTSVPPCQIFFVFAEAGQATVRECPDFGCERRDTLPNDTDVCVYSVAESTEYATANEWYLIDLNPRGAFRDLAYMHSSILSPRNPTPRPSRTFTPLPTVTPTRTFTPEPILPSATPTESDQTPTLTPLPSITPTRFRQEF